MDKEIKVLMQGHFSHFGQLFLEASFYVDDDDQVFSDFCILCLWRVCAYNLIYTIDFIDVMGARSTSIDLIICCNYFHMIKIACLTMKFVWEWSLHSLFIVISSNHRVYDSVTKSVHPISDCVCVCVCVCYMSLA